MVAWVLAATLVLSPKLLFRILGFGFLVFQDRVSPYGPGSSGTLETSWPQTEVCLSLPAGIKGVFTVGLAPCHHLTPFLHC